MRFRKLGFALGLIAVVVLLSATLVSSVVEARYEEMVSKAITELHELQSKNVLGLGSFSWDTPYDDFIGLQGFEQHLGQKMDYAVWFQAMGDADANFQDHFVKEAVLHRWIPIIAIEPWHREFEHRTAVQPEFSFQSVAAGNYDGYFRKWARDAAASKAPMYVRFAQDPSVTGTLQWYPWQKQQDTTTYYVEAFRHVVGLFREEGAENVKFIWSSNDLQVNSQWQFYPGDDWVDVVATTVMNVGGSSWQTFEQLFAPQYAAITSRTQKPIFVIQMGSAEQGGDKAEWLKMAFHNLPAYPAVKSISFWEVQSDWLFPNVNWSVESSDSASTAASQAVQDILSP